MAQEEKFKEAKRLYETANADQRYVLESLFPELAESEDERVRKELINEINRLWESDYSSWPSSFEKKNKYITWLEKQAQKSAWSEEDDRMYNRIVSFIPQHLTAESYTACINWFKDLKDRVLQPKQEWSEEDESRMDNLCHFLEEYGNQYYGHLTLQGTISWLKSLRPKPQWKPSDEQIECLSDAIKHYNSLGSPASKLKELLEDLKKTREK